MTSNNARSEDAVCPDELAALLARASATMRMRGLPQHASFAFGAALEAAPARFVVRHEFAEHDDEAPRLVIYLEATGDYVCRSAPGHWGMVDAGVFAWGDWSDAVSCALAAVRAEISPNCRT